MTVTLHHLSALDTMSIEVTDFTSFFVYTVMVDRGERVYWPMTVSSCLVT